jgi:hypothetical protein
MTKHFAFLGFAMSVLVLSDQSALASAGCSEFRGLATDSTKGEGGHRVGAGFNKGDRLSIAIHQDPSHESFAANLLQYSSPDGPILALTEDSGGSFAYVVPANTADFIYLNFGGLNRGMSVTWGCTPAAPYQK